ncbi:hypothetical protein GCM10010149_59180 [Nonomuraea roseoviolacea subsp. roseoviolacea]
MPHGDETGSTYLLRPAGSRSKRARHGQAQTAPLTPLPARDDAASAGSEGIRTTTSGSLLRLLPAPCHPEAPTPPRRSAAADVPRSLQAAIDEAARAYAANIWEWTGGRWAAYWRLGDRCFYGFFRFPHGEGIPPVEAETPDELWTLMHEKDPLLSHHMASHLPEIAVAGPRTEAGRRAEEL